MKTDIATKEAESSLLIRRVEKLERENKKLKRIALAFGLGILGLFTMGQARPVAGVVPKVIEAEKFVLRDADGRERASLGMTKFAGPELELRHSFDVNAVQTTVETKLNAAVLSMARYAGTADGQMLLNSGGVFIDLSDKDGKRSLRMNANPSVSLEDEQGFTTTIGRADLEVVKTGESRKTSAASIVIFDKGGKVIWRAPIQ
jgi:hypothetical protein